jgi:CRP-like cAMP-binding protein
MKKLIELLGSIRTLTPGLKAYLNLYVQFMDIRKRKILVRPGQPCDRMYFIEWGLLRGSKVLDGKEASLWFMKEGDVMTSVISYYKAQDSAEYIYAMEDSRLYWMTREQMLHCYDTYPEFNFIVRVLTEKYYVLAEERLDMLRRKKASDRYELFLQLYPGLEDRIAAKYIASYLSITMETLSRVKKRRQAHP